MIFISHAARDAVVVRDLVTLLTSGGNVRTEEIFCSSSPGSDIDPGDEFVATIHEQLAAASLVILFITPNYYDSVFCVAEMGGAWALGKPTFPLVAPDVEREIGANMLGRQTERVDRRGLSKLFECLRGMLPPRKWDTHLFEVRRDVYLGEFAEKYPTLPKPRSVPVAELEAEQRRSATAMEMVRDAEGRLARATERITRLEAEVDPAAVREIRREFTGPAEERWEELLQEARERLRRLDAVERRAAYASVAGVPWQPSRDAFDVWRSELRRAVAAARIYENDAFSPPLYEAIREHPVMRPVFETLDELGLFLDGEAGADLVKALEEEFEAPARVDNLDFWENALVDSRLLE